MTTNLLDLLGQAVTPDLLGGLSKLLGESESALGSGVKALLPGLLGAMANKASTSEGASSLFSMVNDARIEPNLTERLPTLVRSVQSTGLLALGGQLLTGLLGAGRENALGSALANASGIRSASAGGLAAAVTPMVFSLIKRLVGERSLDSKGLAALLLGQRDFLGGKLDSGLLTAMGLGSPAGFLDGLGAAASRLTGAAGQTAGAVGAGATAAVAQAGSGGLGRFLPWLIGAGVVLYVLSQLSNCGGTPSETKSLPPAASTSAPASGTAPATPASGVSTAPATTAATAPAVTPAAPAPAPAATAPAASAATSSVTAPTATAADANASSAASAAGSAIAGAAGTGSSAGDGTPSSAAGSSMAGSSAAGSSTTGSSTSGSSTTPAVGAAVGAAAASMAGSTAEAKTAELPARIYFETGSAEISPKGLETIAEVARLMAAGSPARVELTGLTDRTGDLSVNEALSKRRAQAVRAALVAAGAQEADIAMKPPMFVEAGQAGADAEARRVEIAPAN